LNIESIAAHARFATIEQWLAWLETLHPKKIDFGLDRVQQVLAALSLTVPSYRIITVGGTNGKGSCVAMLESIYRAAGYRVGAFTSPHLWRFNERIRFGGADVCDAALLELFELIDGARATVSLSYFEWSSVAALLYFARSGAEVAVLEVGMGGRLDAVNAVDADVSVIASVDLDHQHWLGADRDAIGREKAGIARRGRPAIVADRVPPAALGVELERRGAIARLIGSDFDGLAAGTEWRYRSASGARALPRPPFGGEEQIGNAAAAVAAVEALDLVLPVPATALAEGLAGAAIRGRQERHLIDGVEWVFDVAHNRAAAAVLEAAIREWPRARRTSAVLGMMADKDLHAVLAPFVPWVEEWWLAPTESERSASAESLTAVLASLGATRVHACTDVAAACAAARLGSRPGERVLAFGSFYTAGPAMAALGLYCRASQPGDRSATWTRV
jgi:dihydrofolate synthase / folylpolyglutamate synthase